MRVWPVSAINQREFMPSMLHTLVAVFAICMFNPIPDIFGETADVQSESQSILKQAADEMQVEMSLGQLAAQRASNQQVQEFGLHMAEDHKKVGQQIQLLALQQGITLSSDHRDEQRNNLDKKLEKLSTLSGHAFDREYMDYSIRDHEIAIEQFRQRAGIVQNQGVKQWILLVLPILEHHREQAHRVKYSLQTNP
ncbi:MAG: DUF4142 domain-containing protein [Nitrospira sp.]|nr:DUF4142 domain-containing protein [Nitrospira sp.]